MPDFVCVKTCLSKPEAEVAKTVLEANGIEVMTSTDDCGGMRPHLAFATGGIRLMVKQQDAQKALEILENSDK